MNKKEKKQFEKQLKNDVIKYLIAEDCDLDNVKAINKCLKEFPNQYYTEIKYKLSIDNDNMISVEYLED